MHRGVCADDWVNKTWDVLFHNLLYYKGFVTQNWRADLNEENRANSVEMLTGIAYACYRRCENLECKGAGRLVFHELAEESRLAWAKLWPLLQAIGVEATERTARQAATPSCNDAAAEHVGLQELRPPRDAYQS